MGETTSAGVWELVFLLLILKIPIVYLCVVVWYAIRAEPRPLEGAIVPAELRPGPEAAPRRAGRIVPRRPRNGPHGSPVRTPRAPRVALASTASRRRP